MLRSRPAALLRCEYCFMGAMDYLPVFLKIRDGDCLVIGGGEVALRKIHLLQRAGARITVLAPALCPGVQALVEEAAVHHRAGSYEPALLDGKQLVIAATDDRALNRRVSEDCRARHIPVNVVDDPALCSFVTPSIVDRSPVIVAISSGGAAPVLSRLLRARLESSIPAAFGRLALLAERFRVRVKQQLPRPRQRLRFWERVFGGGIAEHVLAGHEAAAERELEAALAEAARGAELPPQGEVYLVGGGPGDPDLLTFRALRLMQQADVVLYDRLISPRVLELVRRDAEMIDVGKQRSRHTLPQEDINQLLVRLAREGKRVLRLKGGDPFIFGRGGEEIDQLAAAGIPFQVVPGITAASGCASYAGIPLTHRDYAQSCQFVTGHLQQGGELRLNWRCLAEPGQTVVFYMGLNAIDIICRELQAHGLPPTHPAALVEEGTTPRQRVVIGTLADLPGRVRAAGVGGPSLIIVGEVVRLHAQLRWFEGAAG
jgi:uroporphyrin-III C-methyltransferase / precorrin-2 dehydrogenase / sirohydrochlorin ferrochelatase